MKITLYVGRLSSFPLLCMVFGFREGLGAGRSLVAHGFTFLHATVLIARTSKSLLSLVGHYQRH